MEPTSNANESPELAALRAEIEAETLNKVFGGKFKDAESARKGYWDTVNYASQVHEMANQALESRVSPAAQAQARQSSWDTVASESTIDPNILRPAVRDEVMAGIREQLGPWFADQKAKEQLSQEIADYPVVERKAQEWLPTRPDIQQEAQDLWNMGRANAARRLVLREYQASLPVRTVVDSADKLQAAIPGGMAMAPQMQQGPPPGQASALAQAAMRGDEDTVLRGLFPNLKLPT